MNYIYMTIFQKKEKKIAYMNIVDTYNRTGYLDIPGIRLSKAKMNIFFILV